MHMQPPARLVSVQPVYQVKFYAQRSFNHNNGFDSCRGLRVFLCPMHARVMLINSPFTFYYRAQKFNTFIDLSKLKDA